MHEYSLVEDLLRRVDDEARSHGAVAVRRVVLRIGELAGVEPDLLVTAYETLRPKTVCQGAPLGVEPVAAVWSCPGCGRKIEAGSGLQCAACGLPAELSSGGDGVVLQSLELEVP